MRVTALRAAASMSSKVSVDIPRRNDEGAEDYTLEDSHAGFDYARGSTARRSVKDLLERAFLMNTNGKRFIKVIGVIGGGHLEKRVYIPTDENPTSSSRLPSLEASNDIRGFERHCYAADE